MSIRKSSIATLAFILFSIAIGHAVTNAGRQPEKLAADEKLTASEPMRSSEPIPTQSNSKANSDPLYQQLRQASSRADAFSGDYAIVNNMVLKRDAATFTLRSGEVYFLAPIEGRTTGAVFIGEGNFYLAPPTDAERRTLTWYADAADLREDFTQLVLRFTDKTLEEFKQSAGVSMKTGGPQAERARTLFREKETTVRNDIEYNLEARLLSDLLTPSRPGYFAAFINGRRYNKLIFQIDPLGLPEVYPEEVELQSYGESDGGVWAAFHLAQEYQQKTASSSESKRVFDIKRHEIDGNIRGTRIAVADQITWTPLAPDVRVLPFHLFGNLRVSKVQDSELGELSFIQEDKDADANFAVILPKPAEPGKSYKLTVQYEGDGALQDSGGGNYILVRRATWYPNNGGSSFGDRAAFDITFRYPKGFMFVATGSQMVPDLQDGDIKVSKWTSGTTELAVGGFNYGKFMKKELADPDTGYNLEFYANTEIPDELKEFELFLDELARDKVHMTGITGKFTTTAMANNALNDTQNSTRIYTGYFGKIPYSRIAMTQQPAGDFGQAWPTLVFMPYFAFLDQTTRTQLFGAKGGTDSFWRYVGPHEVAHQWWGHAVGWKSYHDQWMSEGFSEFSTSLYVQNVRKDLAKFIEYWDDQRKLIIESSELTKGRKPYTVGPVTQGYRLNTPKTGIVSRFLLYPKGAYILHMIRMMMFDHKGGGDARFREMMQDFIKSHYSQDVTNEDLKLIIEKHMSPQMDLEKNGRMDWFFNAWVYGSEVPAYNLEYKLGSEGGKSTVTARITQSGVSENFRMLVPIYADFGKGWTRLGAAALKGNSTLDLTNVPLPQQPKRLTLCALDDVLYTNLQVNGK